MGAVWGSCLELELGTRYNMVLDIIRDKVTSIGAHTATVYRTNVGEKHHFTQKQSKIKGEKTLLHAYFTQ